MKFIQKAYSILSRALVHEGGIYRLGLKFVKILFNEGLKGIFFRVRHLEIEDFQKNLGGIGVGTQRDTIDYVNWLKRENAEQSNKHTDILNSFKYKPLISIICPIYNPNHKYLAEAISSVLNQLYKNWELCLVDDCSTKFNLSAFIKKYPDNRIKTIQRSINGNISEASNSAIGLSSGDFICFLDQDDVLSKEALLWIVDAVNVNPEIKFIYSDEDKLDTSGNRCNPNFKPDWNYHYLLSRNYICHLAVYDKTLLETLGGCKIGLEGAQDYDLALRASEHLNEGEIYHIPRILYHWRIHQESTSLNHLAKPYTLTAGKQALQAHLQRSNINATVKINYTSYEVSYSRPSPSPAVSIIIPTRNQFELVKACIESVNKLSDYGNYEIVVIDNDSDDRQTIGYLKTLETLEHHRVIWDKGSFNFARLMNDSVAQCQSEFICFLNNDIEVISKNWLSEMISIIIQKNVGIVGAKLLYPDNTIQHGGIVLGICGVAGHAHKHFPNGHPGYINRLESRQEYSAVTGACLLTRKHTFELVGGMDQANLAIAFNDIDYCLKVRDLGLKTVWTPFAVLYHHESKSRGLEDTPSKQDRYAKEFTIMKSRWGRRLTQDPAYNPNLTLSDETFAYAASPRLD